MTGSDIGPIWRKIGQAASIARAPQQCCCRRLLFQSAISVSSGVIRAKAGSRACNYRVSRWVGPGRRRDDEWVEMMALTAASPIVAPEPRAAFDRISLRRLVLIRWVAVVGQALALLVVHFVLEFPLPLLPAFGVVACSAALNLFFAFHHRAATRLGERQGAYFFGFGFFAVRVPLVLHGG